MHNMEERETWKFLDTYRNKMFTGLWPTIDRLFRITVQRYPDRPCFVSFDPDYLSLNYREALEKVEKVSGYLTGIGIAGGDRVALTGKNSPEWAVSYLAVLFAGGIVVPIDYQLEPEKIVHLMDFAGVKGLIADEEKYDSLKEKSREQKLLTVLSLSGAKPGYVFDITAEVKDTVAVSGEKDIAAILFTSGTTGNEKGVMLTHKTLFPQVKNPVFSNYLFTTPDNIKNYKCTQIY